MTPEHAPIAVGTPCYLVGLACCPELNGRVVEVVSGPFDMVDEPAELGPWFQHAAPWTVAMFPGCVTIAPRRCLLPIIPPEPALPAARKRTTERTA